MLLAIVEPDKERVVEVPGHTGVRLAEAEPRIFVFTVTVAVLEMSDKEL